MMEKYAPPGGPYLIQFRDGTRKLRAYRDLTHAYIVAVKHNAIVLAWSNRAQEWRPI